MASIQQSLNQLVAAGLGASVAGKHIYQQQKSIKLQEEEALREARRREALPTGEEIAKMEAMDAAKEEWEAEQQQNKEYEEAIAQQKKAEANSINRLKNRQNTIRNMSKSFDELKQLLSAKDKNRLEHILNKAEKKSSSRKETNE